LWLKILLASPQPAQSISVLVKEVMEGAVKLRVPLRVSVETGKRWGDFH
jgi:DNA polymerase-1